MMRVGKASKAHRADVKKALDSHACCLLVSQLLEGQSFCSLISSPLQYIELTALHCAYLIAMGALLQTPVAHE